MNICYLCIHYITFNRLKWTFFYCNFVGLFLLCHYAGKKVFEKVPKNHYPPINFTLYSEEAYKVCTGVSKKVWNDTCISNQRKTPDIPDECECSDFNMFCDPEKLQCVCKMQEVIKHILHRSRRNKTHHCKVAHYGFCKHDHDCEVQGHYCLKPHRLYLKPPKNMLNARFCLRKREAVGTTSAATRVSIGKNQLLYISLFLPLFFIFSLLQDEANTTILNWTIPIGKKRNGGHNSKRLSSKHRIQHNHFDEHHKEVSESVYGKKTYKEHVRDFEQVGKMDKQNNGTIEQKLLFANNPNNENMDDVKYQALRNAGKTDTSSKMDKDSEDLGLVKNKLEELLYKLDHSPKQPKGTKQGHYNVHGMWLSIVEGAAVEIFPDCNGVINAKIVDLPQPREGPFINSHNRTGTVMTIKESTSTIF